MVNRNHEVIEVMDIVEKPKKIMLLSHMQD